MNYKMIAMDLDDTLLTHDLTILERTKNALIDLQKKGIILVLASGRPTVAIEKYKKELDMENSGYIISYNGAFIKDLKTNETLFEQSISKEYAHKIYECSIQHNTYIHTYLNGSIITPKHNEYTDIEGVITKMEIVEVPNYCEVVNQNVIKTLMLGDPDHLKEVEKKMIDEVGDIMNITISKPFFLEFMDKGIDKGESLVMLAKMLNIDMEEVVAVGDSYNDFSMIEKAGLGIAMGNAVDEIKNIADYITDDNMNNGIANMIAKYF